MHGFFFSPQALDPPNVLSAAAAASSDSGPAAPGDKLLDSNLDSTTATETTNSSIPLPSAPISNGGKFDESEGRAVQRTVFQRELAVCRCCAFDIVVNDSFLYYFLSYNSFFYLLQLEYCRYHNSFFFSLY